MSSQNRTGSRRHRVVKATALAGAASLVLTACVAEIPDPVRRGWLPGSRGTTNNTAELTDLWVNSWIAALIVGVITWALMLWLSLIHI